MIFRRNLKPLREATVLGRRVTFYHDTHRALILMKGEGLRLTRKIAPYPDAEAACAAHIAEIEAAAVAKFGAKQP